MVYFVNVLCFRIFCRGFSAVVTYHNRENMPSHSGICVANHTTTLDVALLMQDRPYAVLGQIHGGYLGWLQRTLSNCARHVWFERSERLQAEYVKKRLSDHVSDPNNYPLLIFPEGTCVNNSAVMMFKKGSFEIPTTIFPVAIKYNPWFGDAFWDSSKHSMLQYLAVVMTSWAIVADVWYLPPMTIREGEEVLEFTGRVQMEIMKQGGLVDCSLWDGQLKRRHVKESERKIIQNQIYEIFSKIPKSSEASTEQNSSDESLKTADSSKSPQLPIAEIVESSERIITAN